VRILEGKAVVITGAGSGLGAAYARHAGKLGAELVLNDVNHAALEAVVAEINAAGGKAVASVGSVSSWDYAAELIAACVSVYGRIDGLVNNAGILRHGRITEMSERDLRAMLDINTIGAAACASHAIRRMLEQDTPGSIVNVASGSQAGDIALGAYGASKAAVASFTYTWALELRDTKVRVNALSPLAHTAMAETNMQFLAQQSASREVVYTTLPAADVNAPAAAFLLSDRSIGINGQLVRIAGNELSFVTHPMIAEPVLKGDWDDASLQAAFRDVLAGKQQKLGLAYARSGLQ
jgi:NAD(P)-dependent dehydrogenase (short-subunit alcohol dehydrogenase family)